MTKTLTFLFDKIAKFRKNSVSFGYEEALDLLVNHFLPDEELNISRGLAKSALGVEEHRNLWAEMLKHRLSIACFKNDELVGVNVLVVNSKDDPDNEYQCKDEALSDILAVLDYTANQVNIYELFKVDKYLTAYGLVINPAYRGRGIATEMINARLPLIRAIGINVISNSFTGIASQIAAKKANYKDIYTIRYDELRDVNPRFKFLNTKTQYYKIMAIKI